MKSGSCATVAIAIVVNSCGNATRMVLDATLQKTETGDATAGLMERAIEEAGCSITSKGNVQAIVIDRHPVNLSAIKELDVPVIFCCMHDTNAVLKALKAFVFKTKCFKNLTKNVLLLQIANILGTSEAKLMQAFLRQLDVVARAEKQLDWKNLSGGALKVITLMAALGRCVTLFRNKLNPMKLEAERMILHEHLEFDGVEHLMESTQQHMDLSLVNDGTPHRITDLSLAGDYCLRSATLEGGDLMQIADKFCGKVFDYVANGSKHMEGRFGPAISVLSPLPAHFAMRHFTHLSRVDIKEKINQTDGSGKQLIESICKRLSKGNGYFKGERILQLKDRILKEFKFH